MEARAVLELIFFQSKSFHNRSTTIMQLNWKIAPSSENGWFKILNGQL